MELRLAHGLTYFSAARNDISTTYSGLAEAKRITDPLFPRVEALRCSAGYWEYLVQTSEGG